MHTIYKGRLTSIEASKLLSEEKTSYERTLTLAAKVVVILQVIIAIFAGRTGSTADVGLTVALTSFLADTREIILP